MKDTGFPELRSRIEAAARLHQSGQRALAIPIYRQLLQEAPRLPPLLNLLGLALVQVGTIDEGLKYLDKAVRLAPNFADAWLNLAFARYEAGDRSGAVAAYRKLLEVEPNHLVGLLSLASLAGESDATETVSLLRRAVQVAPDRALPWLRLRRACLFLSDMAGVAEAEQRIAKVGLKTPEELVEAGHIELMEGRNAAAIDYFRKAREQQPGLAVAALGLGEVLLRERNYPAALAALNEAAALAPRRSSPWTGMGRAHLAMGNREEAVRALRQALERESDPVPQHLLAAAQGDTIPAASADYVKWHYNRRAAVYDSQMRALGNVLPESIATVLRSLPPGLFRNVLDLGCGTGQLGSMLRPLAARLVGLDVSLAMLNVAQRTRRYDDLIEQEAVGYLAGTRERFDLVVAADVTPSIGDLGPLFGQVAEHLDPGGLFVVTFERPDENAETDGFRLQPTGTFTHGDACVRAAAEAAGLVPEHWATVPLPREEKPATGILAAFRKAG